MSFHRDGQPIKYFRRAWLTAGKAAGTPQRIPHDFGLPVARRRAALSCVILWTVAQIAPHRDSMAA